MPAATAPLFRQGADWYDRIYFDPAGYAAQAAWVAQHANDVAGGSRARVLDAGCGTGSLLAALVRGCNVDAYGIDSSAEMLRIATTRVGDAVTLAQLDLTDVDLAARGGRFDLVVSSYGPQHYLPDEAALARHFAAVGRALAPRGRFLLDVVDLATTPRGPHLTERGSLVIHRGYTAVDLESATATYVVSAVDRVSRDGFLDVQQIRHASRAIMAAAAASAGFAVTDDRYNPTGVAREAQPGLHALVFETV